MSQLSGHPHEPSAAALRWVADAVGAGTKIESVLPLAGATPSVLHSIEAVYKGRRVGLVLRQFVNAEWLLVEPDLALHEAANLQKAKQTNVPTPALIAYDESGDYCGVPATLMTRLPGTVELLPVDLGDWLHQLAGTLIRIHPVEAVDYQWSYYPYNDLTRLEPPNWSRFPELWVRAIEVVTGAPPAARECFIHRDYHPNNVLWQDGRVSGVIDWVNACRGPMGIDVAWCRQNLAQLYGVAEADQFLSAYCSFAGQSFAYHPYWDLMAAIEWLPGPPGVYEGWPAFGMSQLNDEIILHRVDDYLASVMARIQ